MSATSDYANLNNVPSQTAGVSPLDASDWNTYVRDNFDALKFGHLVCTVASRPTGVADGVMIFETDSNTVMVRSDGAWVPADVMVCANVGDFSGFDSSHEGLLAYERDNARFVLWNGAAWVAAVGEDDLASGAVTEAKIASGAVTSAKILDGTIVNDDVNAAAGISYSKLALSGNIVNADISSSAAIAYSKLNLAGGIVNADVASGAAIGYSKLSLTGGIVDADVSASAAIASSKLADAPTNLNTANKIVKRDSSGNFSAGTITAALSGNATTATSLSNSSNTFAYQSGSFQWYTANNLRSNGTVYGTSGDFTNLYGAHITGTDLVLSDTAEFGGGVTFDAAMYAPNMTSTASAANMRRNTSSPYGIVYSTSSRRVKDNIEQYIIDPEKLLAFRGVTYTSLCEADNPDLLMVGFIAEEAEEAGLSEFVDYDEDGVVQNFNYAHFTAALLELCKYQESRINNLEERLGVLEAK